MKAIDLTVGIMISPRWFKPNSFRYNSNDKQKFMDSIRADDVLMITYNPEVMMGDFDRRKWFMKISNSRTGKTISIRQSEASHFWAEFEDIEQL